MRSFGILLVLSAVIFICATAPMEDNTPSSSNAEELLAVDTQTAHENESSKKARQVVYFPGLYSGYGYGAYGGYGGVYAGYGGYGAYGYRRYPFYGNSYYPYSFYG